MKSIWEVFLSAVEKYPNKIAIADDTSKYTYKELFDKVKSINGLLVKYKNRNPIVIFAGRSTETVAQILGVIGSGNFYIPLDPTLPKEKIKAIFEDAKPVAVLGSKEDINILKDSNLDVDFYSTQEINNNDSEFSPLNGDEPLYMIYTSGSTGQPKGVLKSHNGMISFLDAFSKLFPFEDDTIIGNQAPLFFDAAAKDLYLSIYNGATLEIIPSQKFILPVGLINYINERKINWICWVPSIFCLISKLNIFIEEKPLYLRKIFFVGEVFPIKHLSKWIENLPTAKFVNLYGSTEISGVCCYYEIKDNIENINVLPMGKALPNCEITLRDNDKVITEPDIVGEIYISSPALALEYYHDKEKTSSVFIEENGKRVFQSGDLARYDKNYNICFVSRKDFQIKHMGRRIELGEIEAVCDKLPEINRCCCLYDERREMITLFCELNADLTSQEIRELLKDKLADYMIPSKVKIYEKLPLNANGKINRQELKESLIERK